MENGKENGKPLKIPENASDRDDYIQGIGPMEVTIILISLVIIIILMVVIYVIGKNMALTIFGGIFLIAIVIMVVKRDSINENMIDKLRLFVGYMRMQKKYEYEQADVLGGGEGEEQNTEDDGKRIYRRKGHS